MGKFQPKKLMWYHSAIIDWMIANPGVPLYECARHVGRTREYIYAIVNSDLFKAALAERKAQFQMQHDMSIIEKTTKVAHASLDAILDKLDKKRDTIPFTELATMADSTLARLGYTAKTAAPGVTVNVGSVTNQQVVLPVSQSDLEEARMAIRQVQQNRLGAPKPLDAIEAEVIANDAPLATEQ